MKSFMLFEGGYPRGKVAIQSDLADFVRIHRSIENFAYEADVKIELLDIKGEQFLSIEKGTIGALNSSFSWNPLNNRVIFCKMPYDSRVSMMAEQTFLNVDREFEEFIHNSSKDRIYLSFDGLLNFSEISESEYFNGNGSKPLFKAAVEPKQSDQKEKLEFSFKDNDPELELKTINETLSKKRCGCYEIDDCDAYVQTVTEYDNNNNPTNTMHYCGLSRLSLTPVVDDGKEHVYQIDTKAFPKGTFSNHDEFDVWWRKNYPDRRIRRMQTWDFKNVNAYVILYHSIASADATAVNAELDKPFGENDHSPVDPSEGNGVSGSDEYRPQTDINISCPKCNAVVNTQDNFCAYCGVDLRAVQPSRCPKCNNSLRGGERFCGKCGAPIK